MAAERALLEFRQSGIVVTGSQYLLERVRGQPFLQFQIASALKEAIATEYSMYSFEVIQGLRSFLLEYVEGQPNLEPPYVVNEIFQVVAIMYKRGWQMIPTERAGLVDLLSGLFQIESKVGSSTDVLPLLHRH